MNRERFDAALREHPFLPVIFKGLEEEVTIRPAIVRQIRSAVIEGDLEEFRKVATGLAPSADAAYWSVWAVMPTRDIFEVASTRHPRITKHEGNLFSVATRIVTLVALATRGHPVYVTVYRWQTH